MRRSPFLPACAAALALTGAVPAGAQSPGDPGSAFMAKVNTVPEAPAPASYTVITTRHDQVVVPYQSQALSGDAVTNVVLQDRCPQDSTDHVGVIYDPVALQWVRNALGRPGPADPAFVPACSGPAAGSGASAGSGGGSGSGSGSAGSGSGPGGSAGAGGTGLRPLQISRRAVRLRGGS